MTKHLPECWAKHESDPPAWCICDELRACEQRMLDDDVPAAAYHGQRGYEIGYVAALDAVRKAVEAIPAPYKIRGDYETYGPYPEGKADMKDMALSAIDALKEDS